MKFFSQLSLLYRLDDLISRNATGTPEQLSRRIGVSKTTLYRQLEVLKNLGAPVAYCHFRLCYYYTHSFKLEISRDVLQRNSIG